MRGESDQQRYLALKLLADEGVVALMRALADGPLRPSELQRRLPDVSHSAAMRRLRGLSRQEIVEHVHLAESPPHAEYTLTGPARELLDVADEAARWERGVWPRGERPVGARALGLVADERVRAIVRTLADGPLPFGELKRRLPRLAQAALARRLSRLARDGVVIAPREHRRQVLYELTPGGRRLASLAMLVARWEWRWKSPTYASPSGDLGGLVHLIAPLARTPPRVTGVCSLHVDAPVAYELGVHLAVGGGRVSALALAPVDQPHAQGHARPPVWCDALAHGDPTGIAVDGDQALLTAVLGAFSVALHV